MYVFDSYVNLFQSPSSSGANRAVPARRSGTDTGGSFNDTISHSAYVLTSRIEKIFRGK